MTPCCPRACRSASTSRRASTAAWIFGCSVLTRPPSISVKPVICSTRDTPIPASSRRVAVPFVATIWTPSSSSLRAKSTRPVLSLTEMSARRTGARLVGQRARWKGGEFRVLNDIRASLYALDASLGAMAPFGIRLCLTTPPGVDRLRRPPRSVLGQRLGCQTKPSHAARVGSRGRHQPRQAVFLLLAH